MTRVQRNLGETPRITLAIAALLYAFSIVLIDIAPFFIGIYVDYLNLSLSQAGFVQTVDQAGGVLGAITGFFLMPRIIWRNIIIVASVVATAANVVTAMADSYAMLLAVRFVSGFGVVLVTTVSACILARSLMPDRVFGIGLAVAMILSAVAVWLLDWLRVDYGYAVSLGSGAIWLGAGLVLSFLLPRSIGGPRDNADAVGAEAEGMDSLALDRSALDRSAMGRSALIALGLFGISVNVVYGYVERIGIANGLDQSGIASALALGYIFSALGSLVPTIFGAMGGRLKWIALTTIIFIATLYGLYAANTVALYTLAFAVYASVWNMGLTYYMSLIAENDPQHKYTRAMYIVNVAAQSVGPAIAASLLTGAPLTIIFVIAPVPALIAAVLIFTVARRTRNTVRAEALSS
jgi:MFS family permease